MIPCAISILALSPNCRHDYHEQGHKDVSFMLAVQCFPHYGAVASTWVFLGYITPHSKLSKKRKGEKDDDD